MTDIGVRFQGTFRRRHRRDAPSGEAFNEWQAGYSCGYGEPKYPP